MPAVTVDDILVLPRVAKPDPTVAADRPVASVTTAPSGFEGEGFPVRRAFAGVDLARLDPFIHMDQMGEVDYAPGEPKGTAWHPHRGFETVTYIIDGIFRHQDSNGGGGLITNGDTQWMTAGGGILHIEEPPEEQPAADDKFLRRLLDVQDPAAGGHPLGVAVGDQAAAAVGVLVAEDAVDDVGDRLEAPVRVPRGALGLTGGVVDLAHLVHVDERVERPEVHPRERAPDREPLSLEPGRCRGYRQHGPFGYRGGVWLRNARQHQDVRDSDGGHVVSSARAVGIPLSTDTGITAILPASRTCWSDLRKCVSTLQRVLQGDGRPAAQKPGINSVSRSPWHSME